MDDMIYVEEMGKAYEIIDEAYKNVDNKSHNMVMLIGTMFTLQATLFLPTLTSNHIGLVACIMGLIYNELIITYLKHSTRLNIISKIGFKFYPPKLNHYPCTEFIKSGSNLNKHPCKNL